MPRPRGRCCSRCTPNEAPNTRSRPRGRATRRTRRRRGAREFHFPRTPDGREVLYLCGNSLGLQPRRAADDVAAFMGEWQRLGVLGYHDPEADWLNLHERLAPTAAALAGARPLEGGRDELAHDQPAPPDGELLPPDPRAARDPDRARRVSFGPLRRRVADRLARAAIPRNRWSRWRRAPASSCCGTRTSSPRSSASGRGSRSCCCRACST